jgi:hypothetical protein
MSIDLKGPTIPALCLKLWQAKFAESPSKNSGE